MQTVQIEHVKVVRYGITTPRPSRGTAITARGHGFPPGARVVLSGVQGMPHLDGQVFVVGDRHVDSEFELLQDRWLEIDSIDAATATVRTRFPHQASFHSPVLLRALLNEEPVEDKQYIIANKLDDFSLQLGCHKTRPHSDVEDGDEDNYVEIAHFTTGAWSGRLCIKYARVVYDQEDPEERYDQNEHNPEGAIIGRGGDVRLDDVLPKGIPECLQEWRSALSASCDLPAGLSSAEPVLEPDEPGDRTLLVGECGWKFCRGKLHPCGHFKYHRGVVRVEFILDIGMWCLFADVAPLDFHDERRTLGLQEWDGPQLLYVCRDSAPTGRWEAVIGMTPAPCVQDLQHCPEQLFQLQPSLLLLQTERSILWEPCIGSIIFGILFTPAAKKWSKHTTLIAVIRIVEIFRDMCNCAAVCRAWGTSLRDHMCLRDMLHRVVYGVTRDAFDPRIPVLDVEALVRIVCHCRDILPHSILQQPSPDFRHNVWGAEISSITVDGTARQALVLFQYAKMLFSDHTLNWMKKPVLARDHDDGWEMKHRFLHTECIGGGRCAQFIFTDRHGVFASVRGTPLFSTRSGSYAYLRTRGVSVLSRSSQTSCITLSKTSREPCPLGRCAEPLSCRCRVSHHLQCQERWQFDMLGEEHVTMMMRFNILPFSACSTDLDVDISVLHPFLEVSDDDEAGESEEDAAESDEGGAADDSE